MRRCCAAGGGVKAHGSLRPPPDRRLSSNESCYAMSASIHRATDGEGAKAKKKGGPVRGRRRWTFRRSTCSARALAEERRCLLWVISGYRSGAIQFLLLWNTPVEFHIIGSGSGALKESPKPDLRQPTWNEPQDLRCNGCNVGCRVRSSDAPRCEGRPTGSDWS